jgi:hypothetical protein
MTLVSSGTLWMISTTDGNDRSIMYEVEGVASWPYNFTTLVSNSSPSVGSLPVSFSDFYSHEQTTLNGRVYATNAWSSVMYVSSTAYGFYSSSNGDSVTYKYTGAGGETSDSCWCAQGPAGQAFTSGQVTCDLFRRTKQTSGSWGSAISSWADYTSQTANLDYTLYDYLWDIQTQ